MKLKIHCLSIYITILYILLSGCTYTLPFNDTSDIDIKHAIEFSNKLPVRVGLYIREDIKNYSYNQTKFTLNFKINVGEYVVPISKEIVESMFRDVVYVNSLPPYNEDYNPDVEAVIEPEIIYAYGYAKGFSTGYIESEFKMRIKAHDLSGNTVWTSEASSRKSSDKISLLDTFFNNLELASKIGYEAAFSSAEKIVKEFEKNKPPELLSLLDVKKSRKRFNSLYKKGKDLYKEKNYHQALYSFKLAEKIHPNNLDTLFFMGVCYTYTARKEMAIEKFKKVIKLSRNSKVAKDSKKWITKIRKPLDVSVILKTYNTNTSEKTISNNDILSIIGKSLTNSKMYNIVNLYNDKSLDITQIKLSFSEIISLENTDNDIWYGEENIAKNISLTLDVHIQQRSGKVKEFELSNNIATLAQDEEELYTLKIQLLSRIAEKLTHTLIQNGI